MIVGVCEHGLGEGMNGVFCPCPPIRNDIVTLRHFYVKQQFFHPPLLNAAAVICTLPSSEA